MAHMSMASVSVCPILNWAQTELYTLLIHTFCSTNYSWITKQLFGDKNIYVANMKCLSCMMDGWMDGRCFRPFLCTVKAELGQGQPRLMR